MKLENQVCTLEQAKRLKGLGVTQHGATWHWVNDSQCKDVLVYGGPNSKFVNPENGAAYTHWHKTAAFTVAELGVMLPDYVQNCGGKSPDFVSRKQDGDNWLVAYDFDRATDGGYGADVKEIFLGHGDVTEAKTRAEVLIRLLEQNLITAEEVNKRLQQS